MLATLAERAYGSGPRVRAQGRRDTRPDRGGAASRVPGSGRAPATKDVPVPVDRRRPRHWRATAGAGGARRRDRRARAKGGRRGSSGCRAAFTSRRRATSSAHRAPAAGRADRVRHPARRRRRPARTAADGTPRASRDSSRRAPVADAIRISEQVAADGRALLARAHAEGWEGLIVKDAKSPYQSGRRSPTWRKLEAGQRTGVRRSAAGPSRGRRASTSAHCSSASTTTTGTLELRRPHRTGFDQKELERVSKLLKARDIERVAVRRTDQDQRAGALGQPDLVAQIRFTEWTADNKLRHPVYLGLRDDRSRERCPAKLSEAEAAAKPRQPARAKRPPRHANADPTRASTPLAILPAMSARDRSTAGARGRAQGRLVALPDGTGRRHQSRKAVLAEAEAHQGRSAPLLRERRAATFCRRSPIVRS